MRDKNKIFFKNDSKFLKFIISNKSCIIELVLKQNNLGDDEKNMLYISQALEINQSIQQIDLS